MNIEKAIKIKENRFGDKKPYYSEEIEEADRLSIEALKRIKANRRLASPVFISPLPGETE